MKVKRLVSVLLAALLLVGMIPMNALAANTATQEEDLLNIQVMVSTEAPEIDEDIYGFFDNDYTDLYTGDSGSQEEARKLVEDTVEAANGIWEWDPSGEVAVEPGTTIYLGFKVSLDKTKTNQFTSLAGFTLKMQYDPDVLVPVHGGENDRGNANAVYNKGDPMLAGTLGKNYTDSEFQKSIILNQMYDSYYVDFFTQAASEIQNADAGWRDNLWADVLKYGGQMKIKESECIVAGGNTAYTGELALAFVSNTGNMPATSEATTWDFVVPMMVKGTEEAGSLNGKNTTDITYRISSSDSGSSTVTVSRVDRTKTSDDLATDSEDYSFRFADYISANDVTVNVVKMSEGPTGTEEDYNEPTSAITNIPNMPFLTASEAAEAANDGKGPNDYITFPDAETGFVVGDTIVVYSDDSASRASELGRTKLTNDNFFDLSGGVDGETPVNNKTLLLAVEGKDGYGYIKNQQTVWIGRIHPDQTAEEQGLEVVVDPEKVVKIDIDPETDLNYNDNIDAVANESGSVGSKDNPIKVLFGEQVRDALLQEGVDRNSWVENGEVEAPAEGNYMVPTTVNWASSWVAGNTDGTGKLFTNKFNQVHGPTTIVSPYADVTIPFEDDETIAETTFHQPQNMVKDDRTATDVPVYGSQVYVKVQPNPADYLLVKDGNAGKLMIAEEARAAWAAAKWTRNSGHMIMLYADDETSSSIATLTGSMTNFETGVTVSESQMQQIVGKTVYVEIVGDKDSDEQDITYDRFAIPVRDADTSIVAGNVKITGAGLNNEVLIAADQSVTDIFMGLDPVFTISDTAGNKEQIHLMEMQTTSQTSAFEANKTNLTITGTASVPGRDWSTADKYDEDKTRGTQSNETVTFTYKIPGGKFYVPSETRAMDDEDDAPAGYKTVEYENPSEFTVSFVASYVQRLVLSDGGDNATITTEIKENNPLGEKDVFVVKGDTHRAADPNKTDPELADPSTIQEGDTVTVFEDDIPITTGSVTDIDDQQDTSTYTIEVEQLGRHTNWQKLSFKVSRVTSGNDDVLPTRLIPFTTQADVPEIYSLKEVLDYNPDTIVWDNTGDIKYTSIEEVITNVAPTTATLVYAYKTKDSAGNAIFDESTLAQAEYTLGQAWTNSGAGGVLNPGTTHITITNSVSLTADLEAAGVDAKIRPTTESGTTKKDLTLKIDVVNEKYNGPDIGDEDPPAEGSVAAAIKVTNKRYPEKDQVALNNLNVKFTKEGEEVTEPDGTELTVYVYASEEDAEANRNAIATFDGLQAGTQSDGPADLANPLEAEGGELYVRAKATDTALSEVATVKYGGEDYTFWKVGVSNDEVKLYRKQIQYNNYTNPQENDKRTEDEQVAFIKNALTHTFEVTAVRYTWKDGGVVADEENAKIITIGVKDAEWKTIDTASLATILGSDPEKQAPAYPVTATLEKKELTGLVISSVEDGELTSYSVMYDEPDTANLRASDAHIAKITIYVTNDEEDAKFEFPKDFDFSKYVTASRHDDTDFTNDTVDFRFADGETPVTTPDLTDVEFKFTIGDPNGGADILVTDTLTKEGQIPTYKVEYNESTPPTKGHFHGIPASTTAIEVYFMKDGKTSSPVTVYIDPLTTSVEITEVNDSDAPITLEITTGSILKIKDLTDLVTNGDGWSTEIESVKVTTKNGKEDVNLLKKPIGGTGVDSTKEVVNWKLWVDTTNTPKQGDGHEVTNEEIFKQKMSKVTEGENYYLVAEFDLSDGKFTNGENLLAKVPIKMYDRRGSDFPLVMTEGNSDLWHNSKGNSERPELVQNDINYATAEITARSKAADLEGEDAYKPEDFKYDAIFYYYTDVYDEDEAGTAPYKQLEVKPYIEEGLESLQKEAFAEEGSFKTWLSENAEAWTVEQLKKVDGTSVERIDPKPSTNASDYFEMYGEYKIAIEEYLIRYKVKHEGTIYVVTRNAKLTYRPGDLAMNGAINGSDTIQMSTCVNGTPIIAGAMDQTEEGEWKDPMAHEIYIQLADVARTTAVNGSDTIGLVVYVNNEEFEICQRW